ncbi:MAG: hypothetical protein JW795_05125 [Chitinivibrionales bacterium]|nr:hypothetical protein [Chitinivibrionales bacterium]
MTSKNYIRAFFFAFIVLQGVHGDESSLVVPPYFVAIQTQLIRRVVSYPIPALKVQQNESKPMLATLGFGVGRIYVPTSFLQLRIGGTYWFGSTIEQSRAATSATPEFAIKHTYKTGSGNVLFCLARPLLTSGDMAGQAIVCLGTGAQYVTFDEYAVSRYNKNQALKVPLFRNLQIRGWSPFVQMGVGGDVIDSPFGDISLTYLYSLSKPVDYTDPRDAVVRPIDTFETFFSHGLTISLLVKLD